MADTMTPLLAHIAGIPVEEILVPLAGGVSALGLGALLVRAWVQARVRRRPNSRDTTPR
jgi:hypothetical protein